MQYKSLGSSDRATQVLSATHLPKAAGTQFMATCQEKSGLWTLWKSPDKLLRVAATTLPMTFVHTGVVPNRNYQSHLVIRATHPGDLMT